MKPALFCLMNISKTRTSVQHKTGAIYNQASATIWSQKISAHNKNLFAIPGNNNLIVPNENYWNTYHITATDRKIIVELNRQIVSQTSTLNDNLVKPGFIGFQVHTGNVQFRNAYIKELP